MRLALNSTLKDNLLIKEELRQMYIMAMFNIFALIILFAFGSVANSFALWRLRNLEAVKNVRCGALFILRTMLFVDLSNLIVSGLFYWLINSLGVFNYLSDQSIFKNILCKSFNMLTHFCFFLNQWTVSIMALERCVFVISRKLNKSLFSMLRLRIGLFLGFCLSFALFCNYLSMYGLRLEENNTYSCDVLAEIMAIYLNLVPYLEMILEFLIPQTVTILSIVTMAILLCHTQRLKLGLFVRGQSDEEVGLDRTTKPSISHFVLLPSRLSEKNQIFLIHVCYILSIIDIGLDFPKSLTRMYFTVTNSIFFESFIFENILIALHLFKFCCKGVGVHVYISIMK
uniref:GCR098 n=1 Tax=Schmidtea mediterranea TaxID=79327 RepID=A0A193KUB5_SCHMD|nr:GCR098 [Schmidtea mediterranea]